MKRKLLAALVAVSSIFVYAKYIRPWLLRWGATDDEVDMPRPGDERVPDAKVVTNHAIAIDAPAEAVWPWLVQMGQGRGGFYTYTWFENLFGTHMRNAERIVPEWQHLAPGDKIHTHPWVGLNVAEVIPGRAIVLEDDWAFFVDPADDRTSRLLVRSRSGYTHPDLKLPPLNFLYWRGVFEPLHFIMERGMLRGIKQRAERAYAESREPAPHAIV
jgi:hypothetical protein